MPSFVITGVSKGLGWEFMKQLSADARNIVVGIIRNQPPTANRVAKELGDRKNITLFQADLTDYAAIEKTSKDIGEFLGGKLDYLVANAGYVPTWDAYDGIGTLGAKPEELNREFYKVMDINVLANIHLYNLFLPLILNGRGKKVVCITSAQGDPDWARAYLIDVASLYAMSKAAMNMVTAKFHAQYHKEGILFLAICPGMVDVGHFDHATREQTESLQRMLAKFSAYALNFAGPDTPEDAVKAVLDVFKESSVEEDGGAFLSHFGNKQWI